MNICRLHGEELQNRSRIRLRTTSTDRKSRTATAAKSGRCLCCICAILRRRCLIGCRMKAIHCLRLTGVTFVCATSLLLSVYGKIRRIGSESASTFMMKRNCAAILPLLTPRRSRRLSANGRNRRMPPARARAAVKQKPCVPCLAGPAKRLYGQEKAVPSGEPLFFLWTIVCAAWSDRRPELSLRRSFPPAFASSNILRAPYGRPSAATACLGRNRCFSPPSVFQLSMPSLLYV